MTSKDDSPPVMSRRNFLKTSTFAGVGLGLGTGGLLSSAYAQAITTISFQGWAFEPQVVEASVKRFMAENPDIRVIYTPLDLQLYAEKMVALFNAGTQGDAFYVRDTHLGAWVEAGWLQPLDGLPKLAELNRDIYPATLQTLFYKGKQYGVPYYGDIYVYLYDKSQLEKAGVKKVPVTLDELKNAALEVKKAGTSQYPILKGYKTNTDGLAEFWSMVFASGGHLFDASMDPLFPNEDKTAVMVLEWMLDLGIPAAMCGFATVLVPVAVCVRGCWRRRTDRYLPAVAFAASMVAILHSVVDFSLQIPAIGFVVSALLGLGWAQAFRRTE